MSNTPTPAASERPRARVNHHAVTGPRPWHSPGDPCMRRSGVIGFAIASAIAIALLAWHALAGGAPDAWTWAFIAAIIATDVAELPVSTSSGNTYKVVVNDALVLTAFASFSSHDSAWLLFVVTVTSWAVMPLSWSMRFAHLTSGLAYRSLLWGAAAATIALGGSAFVAVAVMVATSVAYEFTLFRPFAHLLVENPARPWSEFARDAVRIQCMLVGLNLPAGLIGVAAFQTAPWTVPLIALPILMGWRLALLGIRLQELSDAERDRSRFVSMASHELQTPITSVVGFAATLDERWDSLDEQERRRFLRIVRDQGERLSRLVSQMLVLSRIDASSAPRPVPVDVAAAVDRALLDSGVDADDTTLEIEPGLAVLALDDDVVRVVVNLLTNADKYGRPPIRVDARSVRGGWAAIAVCDAGDGISKHDQLRMFEHFARGEDVPSNVDGSGLGLAIARSVARRHGGDLDYEPGTGRGACFVLRLPRASDSTGVASSTPEERSIESSVTATSVPSGTSAGSDDSSTGE